MAQSSYVIRPFIGSGSVGDGGAAIGGLLDGPYGLARDASGNVYVSESRAGTIRIVHPDGTIARFAGTGNLADGTAGQAALNTDLISPASLLMDSDGGLLFADTTACRIRKVLTNGTIQNVVGTGRCPGTGGFGPGGGTSGGSFAPLQTTIGAVGGMTMDGSGRLIFSDTTSNVVRRLDSDGIVRTIAGTGSAGYSGDSSTAITATLRSPKGVTVDNAGIIYIADSLNCRVRAIATDGTISTVVGNGVCATFTATASSSHQPGYLAGLFYDSGTNKIFISSPGNGRILALDVSASTVAQLAGSGTHGAADSASAALYPLDQPADVLVSGSTVLVADNSAYRVLQIQSNTVTAYAGTWPQVATYPTAPSAALLRPGGLCFRTDGSIVVSDTDAGRILLFSNPNQLTAFAGKQYPAGYEGGDGGPALAAQLQGPGRLACSPSGTVYFIDGTLIRAITTNGTISTAVSSVEIPTGNTTGVISNVVALQNPSGIAMDPSGAVVFSDAGLNCVFRYDPSSQKRTVLVGTCAAGFSGDGAAAISAHLNSPGDLAYDSRGNLYIADNGNGRVREVTRDGNIQTVAGAYFGFSYADFSGQPATSVGLGAMTGLALDSANQIYILESSRVSVVRSDGNIYILAGYQNQNDSGAVTYLGGPMYGSVGLTVAANGRIYTSSQQLRQVLMLLPPGDPGPAPVITGLQSAPDFGALSTVSSGSWLAIYGANLAGDSRAWAAADFSGSAAPISLDGTTVTIGGQSAYVSYISPRQVNVEVPAGLTPGAQNLTVSTAGGTSPAYSVQIANTAPGLLAPYQFLISGRQYAGALFPDGSTYVLAVNAYAGLTSRPARSGDTILLYGIGFGSVTPSVGPGTLAGEVNKINLPLQIFFNQVPATITYAGLVVGETGLYQFNVVVPDGISAGDAALTFSLNGVPGSQTLYVPVTH